MKLLLLLSILLIASQSFCQAVDWAVDAHPNNFQVNGIAYTSDGTKILSGTNCHPAKLRIYNSTNGQQSWDYSLGDALMCVLGVGFSSNGDQFAAIEEFGNLLIFDNSGQQPALTNSIQIGTSYGFNCQFSPSGNSIIVGGSNGKIVMINKNTGQITKTISGHSGWVMALKYSPDGSYFVSGGIDNQVKIWDTTGTIISTLSNHTDDISSIDIKFDGSRIYTASKDKTVKCWDRNGNLLSSTSISSANINAIALSPDANVLVAVSSDAVNRFYSTYQMSLIDSINETTYGEALCVAWSPNNYQVSIGTITGMVVAYSVDDIVGLKNELNVNNNISIYPNPSNGYLNIQNSTNQNIDFEIVDVSGKSLVLQTITAGDNQFNFSKLKKGLYFIVLRNGNDYSIPKTLIIN